MKYYFYRSKAVWAIVLFYLLIAFEFFYMASPFAIYFYAVYKPGLEILNNIPLFSWLTGFFLPHLVKETHSSIINVIPATGWILAIFGMVLFLVGAVQVYFTKIFKRDFVRKGLYKYIRHPQYTAFLVSSFGMLLIWPRYLSLLFFVSMAFVYYWLARKEEAECTVKFGGSYKTYLKSTYMFLPFNTPKLQLPDFFSRKPWLSAIFFYFLALNISFAVATSLKAYSIDNLYSYESDGYWLSIFNMEETQFSVIRSILENNPKIVSLMLSKAGDKKDLINYVVPLEMYISEIPMVEPANFSCHELPENYNPNLIKVIVTQGVYKNKQHLRGVRLLEKVRILKPILEVHLDIGSHKVLKLIKLPDEPRYQNIPEPIF